jgi:Mg2+ and Co2+ transporter CorA
MDLKKKLKKNLYLLKEGKERFLIEEKIVKSRLNLLPKNVNKNSKIQVTDAFNKLFEEIKFYNSNDIGIPFLNENLVDVLGQMFNEDSDKFLDTIKDKLTDFLVSKLQGTDFDREAIEMAIGDTELDDISKLFTDTRFLAKKLAEIYSTKYNEMSLDLSSLSGPTVSSQISSGQSELEDKIVDQLRPIMGDINSKMELKLSDIRDGIIS